MEIEWHELKLTFEFSGRDERTFGSNDCFSMLEPYKVEFNPALSVSPIIAQKLDKYHLETYHPSQLCIISQPTVESLLQKIF